MVLSSAKYKSGLLLEPDSTSYSFEVTVSLYFAADVSWIIIFFNLDFKLLHLR